MMCFVTMLSEHGIIMEGKKICTETEEEFRTALSKVWMVKGNGTGTMMAIFCSMV